MVAPASWSATPRALSNLIEDAVSFHDCSALTVGTCTATNFASSAPSATLGVAAVGSKTCLKAGTLTDVGGAAGPRFDDSGPFRLRGKRNIHFLVYCTDWLTLASFSSITILFDDGVGGLDATNFLSTTSVTTTWVDGNWFLVSAQFSEDQALSKMTYNGTASTVSQRIVADKVMRVTLRVSTAVGKPDFYIGGVWFGGKTRPKALLCYDGCYISQKTVAKVQHDLYGIPGTLYVPYSVVGSNDSNYLKHVDLDSFYASRWAIAMHSWDTMSGLETYASAQQIVDQIGAFQRWQRGRGFTLGLGHMAYPTTPPNSMTPSQRAIVMAALIQSGIKTIRHGGALTNVSVKSLAISGTLESPKGVFFPQLQTNGSPVTVATALSYFQDGVRAGAPAGAYIHEIAANGSTQGSGIVGQNYWRSDFYSGSSTAFIESLVAMSRAGFIDFATIAEYD